jgi:hypothetical protein
MLMLMMAARSSHQSQQDEILSIFSALMFGHTTSHDELELLIGPFLRMWFACFFFWFAASH